MRGIRVEKIVGGILGVGMLITIFLAPFSSAISVLDGAQSTLYGIFQFFLVNFSSLSSLNNTALELIGYFYFFGAILIILAGVIGSLPLLSGSLGTGGMALVAASGLFSPQYTPYPVIYGIGFFILWSLSIFILVQLFVLRWIKNRQTDRVAS
jgi:hypothetical protein